MDSKNDILKWHKAAQEMFREEKKEVDPTEKLNKDLDKTDKKIMQAKLEKLNMHVKKKYLETNASTPEEKMFQFDFRDRGDYYEFSMPINILFGPQTREFCAKYWDSFFEQAGIDVTFKDNIANALKQTGGISLIMKLNKKLTKEIQPGQSPKAGE
jgi:hypothetical protein